MHEEEKQMINFPKFGEIGKLIVTIFNIMIEKKVLTENELVGFLTKSGFTFTKPQPLQQPANNPEVDLTKHERECLCEECQKQRGLQ